jgi:MFS transporter, FHS family, L-fucose permease
MKKRTATFPFILITSLFFLWGFVHNLDPILIPHLRKAFQLTTVQSSLVDSAVFVAYFVMALPAGYVMQRYGYKAGIILGLLLFALGSYLFVPAANTQQYIFFLAALFIIASGLTMLETAANPYVTILGPEESAAQRLNLAQSFNGLAVTIAPLIGGRLILSGESLSPEQLNQMSAAARAAYLQAEASSVKLPYVILGSLILLVALFFVFTRLPDIKEEKTAQGGLLHALRHRHLRWAVIAQFFYVGAQVCVSSFFILFTTKAAAINEKTAADYLGLGYGLAFMSGRFIGTYLMRFVQPAKLLTLYAAINIVLTTVAILTHGMVTVYALIGVAFFMSIMFPTIFALGIKELGKETKIGASLIIMSIVGGALLPPLLGLIADRTANIQNGYVVPLVCFAVVLYFGWKGYRPSSSQQRPVGAGDVLKSEQLI